MESALRPRDIQARIRAGESPESVAEAAQTTVDRIMSYANPVLAERAHIAERAQRASIRRKAGEGPARILGDTVSEQLRARNLDPESVDWDSWRRDDGRWALVAAFRTDERSRRAEFVFDVQGRYVVAEDDDARWLVGEQPTRRHEQPQPTPGGPRRLSAVGPQEELGLGDDAIEMVTGRDSEAPAPEERTVDLTQTARELRSGTTARPDDLAPTGDADWMATQASDRPQGPRREDVPADTPPAQLHRPAEAEPEAKPEGAAEEATEPETPEPAQKKTRKGRRASVPSWDEIMFGGGRSE